MSTAFDTTVLNKSLVVFLVKKGFLNADDAPEGALTPKAEMAYKAFAEHKCGAQPPFHLPANLDQVPVQILNDEDWVYDGEVVLTQATPAQAPAPVQTEGTEETTQTQTESTEGGDDSEGEGEEVSLPSTPIEGYASDAPGDEPGVDVPAAEVADSEVLDAAGGDIDGTDEGEDL
jgi:hypothetical protein